MVNSQHEAEGSTRIPEVSEVGEELEDILEDLSNNPEQNGLDAIEVERQANEKISSTELGQELISYIDERNDVLLQNAPIGGFEKFKYFIGFGGPKAEAYKGAKRDLKKVNSRFDAWVQKEGEYILAAEKVIPDLNNYLEFGQQDNVSPREKKALRKKIQKANINLHKKRAMLEDKLLPDLKSRAGLSSEIPIEERLQGIPSAKEVMDDYRQKEMIIGEMEVENYEKSSDFHDLSLQLSEKLLEGRPEDYKTLKNILSEYIRNGELSEEADSQLKEKFNLKIRGANGYENTKEIMGLVLDGFRPMLQSILREEKLNPENLDTFFKEQSIKSLRTYAERLKEKQILETALDAQSVDAKDYSARKVYQLMEMTLNNERNTRAASLGVKIEMKKAVFSQLMRDHGEVVRKHLKEKLAKIVGAEDMEIDADTYIKSIMGEGSKSIAAIYQSLRLGGNILNPKTFGTLTSPVFATEGKALSGFEALSRLLGESKNITLWRINHDERRNNSARRVRERKEALTESALALGSVFSKGYAREDSLARAIIERIKRNIAETVIEDKEDDNNSELI